MSLEEKKKKTNPYGSGVIMTKQNLSWSHIAITKAICTHIYACRANHDTALIIWEMKSDESYL